MKKVVLGFVSAMTVAELRGLNNLWDGDLDTETVADKWEGPWGK